MAKKKKFKLGSIPDFGDCQDLEVMQQTFDWLSKEKGDIDRSFRSAT